MALGHQDLLLTGSEFLFKRDPVGATQYPLLHLGDIEPASPAIATTVIEALTSATGRIKLRDKRVIEFIESYAIQTRNLRQRVLELAFLSSPAVDFTQAADPVKTVSGIPMRKGELVNVEDLAAKATYFPERICGFYKTPVTTHVVTAVSRSAKTITTSSNASGVTGNIILDRTGLSNPKNARTYTVVSAVGAGPTTITVLESPASDETAITGQITANNGGTIYHQGNDWIPYLEHALGYAKIMPGGAIVDGATDVLLRCSLPAVSGKRIIKPKSLTSEARGKGYLIYGRSGNAEKTYREFQCVITPQGTALAIEAFSNVTLNVKVLSDLSSEEPAGRLVQALGTLPTNA